jgi:archaetidylinositol phosphate synthase
MTLDRLRPVAERALDPFVDAADRVGLTPDGVSVVAFALAVAAGVAFLLAADRRLLYLVGAMLVFGNGVLDLLDGQLARRQEVASAAGDLLDHALDRYADIAVIAGLAAGVERYAVGFAAVTGVLMTSYLGTQAQAVGLDRVYGGLVGRADRLALVGIVGAVAAFVPTALRGLTVVGWLLVFFAVVGHFTALQRFYHAMGRLRNA